MRPGDGPSPAGLPHSEIRGSMGMCPSPRPLAAYRVLPRLAAPQASAMNLCFPGHVLLPATAAAEFGHGSFSTRFASPRGKPLSPPRAFLPISRLFQRSCRNPALRGPELRFMGRDRVELSTPALSERCSNQLSYHPVTAMSCGRKESPRTAGRHTLPRSCFPFSLKRR